MAADVETDQRVTDEASAATEQQLGNTAPPATEVLAPENLQALGQMIGAAYEAITEGQVTREDIQFEPAADAIPPGLWKHIVALMTFTASAADGGLTGAIPYSDVPFVEMSASNDGLIELAGVFDEMSQDQGLAQEIQRASDEAAQMAPPPDEGGGGEQAAAKPEQNDRAGQMLAR